MKQQVRLRVNDSEVTVLVEPRRLLSDLIREDLGLTGTRVGCEQGVCGACTVHLDGEAVRSCLMFGVQAQDRSIRTVESLASPLGELDDVQLALREHHGLQCGFCTAGFLMTIHASLTDETASTADELLSGNLCRCTGYQGLRDAVVELLGERLATARSTEDQ
jgi:carbon-monoxide dehydrogenase small subunit